MAKKTKLEEVTEGCSTCAGRGYVQHHHVTNKRNKKQCPACEGKGEVTKMVEVEY